MLKIRLSRTGKKNQPSFRVVVQEHTSPIKGKFVEMLGYYRPADNPKVFEVDAERVKYWISVGAQPSDTVAVLLKRNGVEGMDKYISPRNKQAKKKKEEEVKEAAPAPAAPAEEKPAEEAPAPEEPTVEEAPAEETPAEETPAPAEEPQPEESPAEETQTPEEKSE